MMKRMRSWQWAPDVLLLAICGTTARADGFAIQSFDGTGRLTFNEISTAAMYRVEWAPSPAGPWTTFTAAALALNEIVAKGSGIVTCSVPMCYRVVASMAPDGMVLIPGGMNVGTDPDFGAYSLTVDSFFMDRYEVTKTLWDEVYNWAVANGYSFDNNLDGEGPHGQGKAADHPVQTVNWYDCVKWCNARSQKAGLTPVYYTDSGMTQVYKTGQVLEPYVKASANDYRLPTDVQWEYAARGGVANRRFPWNDSDDIQHARANYYSSSSYSYDTSPTRGYNPTGLIGGYPYTSPAGSFAANGYGLSDMAGNVHEWCYDWSPGYTNSYRVLRGGGWVYNADSCRAGGRDGGGPNYAVDGVGFRAVLPPDQP